MSHDMEQIEKDFLASWDKVQLFFERLNYWEHDHILKIITYLRDRGYDRKLRAGQSIYYFVLSRSRHHRLRKDFARLFIILTEDTMQLKYVAGGSKEEYEFDTISVNDKLIELVDKLASRPIDDGNLTADG